MAFVKRQSSTLGYTLVEVMIVVGLVGMLAALAVPNVQLAMDGKPPRKIILVANRIVNVVV